MSWTEVAGFASGALCVWLVVKQHVGNFPVGIANNVFFIVLFVGAGLYADAGLQVVYIALAAWGWWCWLRGGPQRSELPVQRTPRVAWPVLLVGIAGGTAVLSWALSTWTNSTVAGWDALTTVMSLAAQVMLNRKWIGNWWVWIAADVIYIVLYAVKDLWLTSGLYVLFLALCVQGLREWRRALAADPVAVATDSEEVVVAEVAHP